MTLTRRELTFNQIKKTFYDGLDLLFPPQCAGCGSPGSEWCSTCQKNLERLDHPFLLNPIEEPHAVPVEKSQYPGEVWVWSYAWYRSVLIKAILSMKYRPNKRLGRLIAGWLRETIEGNDLLFDVMIPVPLNEKRQRLRGYNQVELIGQPLSQLVEKPLLLRSLTRVRDTGSQVGKNMFERKQNVLQAFTALPQLIEGKRILLLDDIVTTGSTMLACAEALNHSGAINVIGLTIARA